MKMGEQFTAITIPDVGVDGLSKAQNDKLLVEMGGGINQLHGAVNNLCKTTQENSREIHGHKGYPGLKGAIESLKIKVRMNTKLIFAFGIPLTIALVVAIIKIAIG